MTAPAAAPDARYALWPDSGRTAGLLVRLGRLDYQSAWDLQLALARDRRDGLVPDLLLLVEHPPTITLGRTAQIEHLLADEVMLASLGISVFMVDRGGDITYHGPGQLVGYPIIDLLSRGRDVHRYLRLLEETLIRTLADLGLTAGRLPPHTGVWIGVAKIAAIGIKVSRGVTLHGFALNHAPDLSHFAAIVPCGIHDKQVTSIAQQRSHVPAAAVVEGLVAGHCGALAGIAWRELSLAGRPSGDLRAAILAAAQDLAGPVDQ